MKFENRAFFLQSNGVHGDNADVPENEGGFVVPYNRFRRLRLESIRQALGLSKHFQISPCEVVTLYGKNARLPILAQPNHLGHPLKAPLLS